MLEELFSLSGRVALVTGGNGGLGRALALGLRAAGARVAVSGRDTAKNAQVATELGPNGAVLSLDVRDEEAVAGAVGSVVERFGHLDVLALAVELAPHDVQVNAILPGWFPTAMTGGLPHTPLGEQIQRKTLSGRSLGCTERSGGRGHLSGLACIGLCHRRPTGGRRRLPGRRPTPRRVAQEQAGVYGDRQQES